MVPPPLTSHPGNRNRCLLVHLRTTQEDPHACCHSSTAPGPQGSKANPTFGLKLDYPDTGSLQCLHIVKPPHLRRHLQEEHKPLVPGSHDGL